MSDGRYFHELLRIANIQIESIVKVINDKATKESEAAHNDGYQIDIPYFRVISHAEAKMQFSIGLKKFLVVSDIFPGPLTSYFVLETYEIYEDYNDGGRTKYNKIPALSINGNPVFCKFHEKEEAFEVRGAGEPSVGIGQMYIRYLLELINTRLAS